MRVECKSEITKISCTKFVPQKNQVAVNDLVFLLADCWLSFSVQPTNYVTGCYTAYDRDY